MQLCTVCAMHSLILTNMNIDYYVKNVYGNEMMYIKDDAIWHSVSTLTQRKTLLNSDKKALEALGFSFTQVLP